MKIKQLDTLSETMNSLTKNGFTDSFKAKEMAIEAIYAKRSYNPEDLKIMGTYRFEGETNPADQTVLFAIEANDGIRGTLTMSYSSDTSQNEELVKKIKVCEE